MDDVEVFVLVSFFSRKGHCGVGRHKAGVSGRADLGSAIHYATDSSVIPFPSQNDQTSI